MHIAFLLHYYPDTVVFRMLILTEFYVAVGIAIEGGEAIPFALKFVFFFFPLFRENNRGVITLDRAFRNASSNLILRDGETESSISL